MLIEELPVNYEHKNWCRWTARLLVLCIAGGCLINLIQLFGYKVLLATLPMLIGFVFAKAIRAIHRRQ